VIPGDYDGDGKTDLALARDFGTADDQPLEWIISKSSNDTIVATQFGDADLGDIPVPADYNGDGRTDFAVWRYKETKFLINGIASFQFGSNGDLPVASYDIH